MPFKAAVFEFPSLIETIHFSELMDEYPENWLWEGFSANVDGIISTYSTCELTDFSRKSKSILVSATNFNDKLEDHCFRLLRFDRFDFCSAVQSEIFCKLENSYGRF